MPWLLIDRFSQNVNGFRYVSENRGKFWICSYRQSGGVIRFSTVSGHIESIAVLSKVREPEVKKVNSRKGEKSVFKRQDFQYVY